MMTPTRLRDAIQMARQPSFNKLLNLLTIDGDVLVGADLQFTRVLQLTCPDTLYFNEQETLQHAVGLSRLLNSLPLNCTAQLLVQVRWDGDRLLDRYAAQERPAGDMQDYIFWERVNFLKQLAFKRVEHFLAITTHPTNSDLKAFRPRGAAFELQNPTSALLNQHKRRINELGAICNNAAAALREAKVSASALNEEQLRAYLFERLNPGTARRMPPPKVRSALTLRAEVALNAANTDFDTFTLDGHFHRCLNLQMRPEKLDGRAMHVLYNEIPGDYDLTVSVHSLDQEEAEKRLKATAAAAIALDGAHITRYHEAGLVSADADDLLADTKASDQKIFLASVHVALRATDRTLLTTHHEETQQAFRRLEDAEVIVDDMNHRDLFLASLPGHAHLNQRVHTVHTAVAARLLTASASWNGHSKDPQLVIPCDDNKLIGMDLFDPSLPVKHSLILGVSGEGKSVLGNTLLASFSTASDDNHVIIIDDGGSYRRFCHMLGGQYLEPTLDGAYSFNPFLARQHAFTDRSGKELDADFLSRMKLLVRMMVGGPDLTPNEKTIIETCVLQAYSICRGDTPILSDLREAFKAFKGDQKDSEIAQGFYKNLALWTEGSYGRLFNRQSTFDASSRLVVFDLTKMTQDDLKPVFLLAIKSVVHPKLANKRLRKVIALDEVWKFLKDKAGADLVTEWYKTGRKFNTAVWVMTQSAGDLLKSSAAEAIAENSTIKWILNLGGGYEKLAELKLTPVEIEHVRSLGNNADRSKYRKVFVKWGEGLRNIVRNILSPRAYWIFTTDPQDFAVEATLKEKEPTWAPAQVIDVLGALRETNPQWTSGDYLRAIKQGRYCK